MADVVCDGCGEHNPAHARFCLGCGAPLDLPGEAARKLVSVVFADVVGSTALGERLDPEAVREVMLGAFRRIEAVVAHHGGTVEKFVGDAVMAVFGIPRAHEDDALRAVRAALEIRATVAEVGQVVAARHGVGLELRTGVNTGEVMTGSGRQTLVTGDAVNLAARLEQAAAPGEVLVGSLTARLLGDLLDGEPVGPLTVKGKAQPVTAVRVRGLDEDGTGNRGHRAALVGRTDELGRLDAALAGVVDQGAARTVTVLAGPGVGKTRLLEECLARWRGRVTPFVGRCPPYGRGITHWPLREAVRRRVTELGGPDAEPEEVLAAVLGTGSRGHELARDVLAFVGLRRDTTVGDGASAVRSLLEALSRDRPLVVVLDDAQWAEPGLLDLVEHVLRWWRGGPLLAVVLARPELRSRRPDWPGAGLAHDSLELRALDDGEAGVLVDALAGGVAADRRARLVRMAGGNPLFLEELVHAAVDGEAGGEQGATATPAGVRGLLTARLDRLAVPDRVVLQRAAVVGESFALGAVGAMTPAAEADALSGRLLGLVREDLVRPADAAAVPGTAGLADPGTVDRYEFRHLLVRDVAYDGLPRRERSRLHEVLATWLEAVAGRLDVDLDALVGHHLERAADELDAVGGDLDRVAALSGRAGAALHAAGVRAHARGDVPGTVDLLGRAAGRLDADPSLPLVLGALGSALTEAGDLDRAGEVLDRAVAVAEAAGDERARTHAVLFRLWLASAVTPAGWSELARDEAERAIVVSRRLGDDLGLARAWVVLAEVRWSACRFAAVDEALHQATAHARRAGDLREEVENAAALTASAVEGPLPVDDGMARCRATLDRYGRNQSVRARTLRSLGLLRALAGDPSAVATVDDALAGFRDLGQAYWLAVTTGARGRVHWTLGDPEAAEADLRRAVALLDDLGDRSQRARVAALLGRVVAARGDADEALALARSSRDDADVADLEPQLDWRMAMAAAHLARGDASASLDVARRARELAAPTDALVLQVRAAAAESRARAALGDRSGADRAAADVARLAAAKGVRHPPSTAPTARTAT